MGIEDLYGDFLPEAAEPYYVWIGKELNPALQEGNGSLEMLVGVDQAAVYPNGFRPIVDFFSELRPESAAKEWLHKVQAPKNALQVMVDKGDLAVIRPHDDNLESLCGIRLQPNGRLVVLEDGSFALTSYEPDMSAHEVDSNIKLLLFSENISDLPSTLKLVSNQYSIGKDELLASLYHYLPLLLAGKYAFFLHEEK